MLLKARGGSAGLAGLALKRVVVFFGSPELLTRSSRLVGPVWAHAFGSTEQGAATTRLLPSDVAAGPGRLTSVGRSASPDLEVAITDPSGARVPVGEVGEILVRSAMSAGWYWDMPDRNEACFYPGGWFRSGDVGYLDADGFLFYGDRASDTIQVDGQVIYPHTVEAALLAHDSVANCGVVAVARGDGAVVTGAVILKAGRADCAEELRALMRDAVGRVARDPEIVLVSELPTVLGGAKVQRGALRERLEAAR